MQAQPVQRGELRVGQVGIKVAHALANDGNREA
jgi:hypothetical protein